LYNTRYELGMPDIDFIRLVDQFNKIRKIPQLIIKCLELHIVKDNNY